MICSGENVLRRFWTNPADEAAACGTCNHSMQQEILLQTAEVGRPGQCWEAHGCTPDNGCHSMQFKALAQSPLRQQQEVMSSFPDLTGLLTLAFA